ncbi:hypothetical protein BVIR_243 [Blastochloris viridis]|uniref:Uncharacterized protein n=1 Tax=Blastochloris viridis TaxID=1079 RepID=A0A0P0JG84_BLAVI|nr:hypothetical protein BVIR_243 [Blastochloris viridis]CUU43981.1 hypothetical protein BVIRIDIS_30090 [Blastochloris viridis]
MPVITVQTSAFGAKHLRRLQIAPDFLITYWKLDQNPMKARAAATAPQITAPPTSVV